MKQHINRIINIIIFYSTFYTFFLAIYLWLIFDRYTIKYQGVLLFQTTFLSTDNTHLNIQFGIDGISLVFLMLTTLILLLIIISTNKTKIIRNTTNLVYYYVILLGLLFAFTTLDLLVFFIFFESLLIPMYLLIGKWGSRYRKVKANFYFFLYTLLGSIFLLFMIISLYLELGTSLFTVLQQTTFDYSKEHTYWICIFVAFSVKTPTFPFHLWLPEAHVEAPTSGSVILAALLLKLGGYGFLRINIPCFYASNYYYSPYLYTLCIVSIVYASLTAARQVDLKRIIAYSSIAHMNFGILGLFSLNLLGIQGSIFLMISHGIVSAAMFFCIGVLYERHHSRNIYYYGGLSQTMPIYSAYLLIFSFANIGLPGTCNFIGEFLIMLSLVDKNIYVLILATTSVILGVAYTITMLNKIIFGNLKNTFFTKWGDIRQKENYFLIPLVILTVFFGFVPNVLLELTLGSIVNILYLNFYT